MKITELYVYPIKGLRPIPLQHAQLTPQGIKYDRTFMLYHVKTKASDDGSVELKKMQLSSHPQCALFEQTILSREDQNGGSKEVLVKWHAPAPAAGQGAEEELELLEQAESAKLKRLEAETITVELDPPPRIEELERVEVDLHGSPTTCYKVGEEYDRWFSERFGFEVMFVYLGDGKRQILGTSLLPPATSATHSHASSRGQSGQSTPQRLQPQQQSGGGWLSTITSLTSWFPTVPISVPGFIAIQGEREEEEEEDQEQQQPDKKPWITFTDVAPLLITSESSLSNLSARLTPESPEESTKPTTHPQVPQVPMYKMRPNLVVDGKGEEAWAEDYWGELVVTSRSTSSTRRSTSNTAPTTTNKKTKTKTKLHLTGNCARCTSLNVDYDTGKPAKGEMGAVLKKLMKDRRVDPGMKWSPVFGRYAFVGESAIVEEEEEEEEEGREVWISVGDEVQVTRRNEERTVMDWPF
ncbi:hypothetical protein SMACR_07875 [Sordaria macrospora]|uniref:WGS project CABT00000000 data, contig 2.49 n=2 Tax=Sordaria macrospora TaxID=5147 RepID=F7W957_SORMK|nr:uncharacterized protein SMAC_07875 [Sordaria macrospora k-hell]KAA8627865.1 hypothetical protein SMACR_07875 [Sordaria macrospora]WPJ63975.1 hypothetical protein SMAC4_07875 [Sordaria macrospora]CCC05137.1 unnamed protein product [Sordaria macrospora k-hell]